MYDNDFIEALSPKQFAVLFETVLKRINEDPIENFIKAAAFMDLVPSAPQEVFLKVFFQKLLDPITQKDVQIESTNDAGEFIIIVKKMTEVEIYKFLTDKDYDPDKIASIKINKINLIMGRRSGKTLMSAIIAIYSSISMNWKPFLSKTPWATVLILSHSKEFSDEVLDQIKFLIEASPILSRLKNKKRKQTNTIMNLAIPFIVNNKIQNSLVQIKVGAASKKTTRGVAACCCLLDEIAHWNLAEGAKESDALILEAVRPCLKQFGKHGTLIKLSSPAIKMGVLYDEYQKDRRGELPATYAIFKSPSWTMNTFLPKEEFVEEWYLDPVSFDVEYRANFADSLSNFIVPESVDKAVCKGIKYVSPTDNEKEGVMYFAAIDAAYKSDKFTFSLVGVGENRVVQYISKGWQGTQKDPVSSHDVAAWIRNAVKDFPLNQIVADQFAFQPLREIFDQYGLTLVEYTYTNPYKKQIYFNLKNLIHRSQVDLLDNELQTKELKELVVEQTSTGIVRIGHPVGGSDDFADSLAVACYQATENQGTGQFEFESMLTIRDYDIPVDSTGKAFDAPSPEMLVQSGHLSGAVIDNALEYGLDPEDGKLKRFDEFEDEDDGPTFIF